MPRPRLPDTSKLSRRLLFRCSDRDHLLIRAKAAVADLPLSDYLRHAALNGKVVVKRSAFDPKLWIEINRVGVNLNQFVKLAHHEGVTLPPDTAELRDLLNAVLTAMSEAD